MIWKQNKKKNKPPKNQPKKSIFMPLPCFMGYTVQNTFFIQPKQRWLNVHWIDRQDLSASWMHLFMVFPGKCNFFNHLKIINKYNETPNSWSKLKFSLSASTLSSSTFCSEASPWIYSCIFFFFFFFSFSLRKVSGERRAIKWENESKSLKLEVVCLFFIGKLLL